MIVKAEAILILNPVKNFLSAEVYCCFIEKLGFIENALEYLNKNYSSFIDAVNLVAAGQIKNLHTFMHPSENRRNHLSFQTLSQAKDKLKNYDLYFYDMSGQKYQWVKINSRNQEQSLNQST